MTLTLALIINLIKQKLKIGLAAKENSLGNPAVDDYILKSSTTGTRSWIKMSGGHIIQNSGTNFTQRDTLNFLAPFLITDTSGVTTVKIASSTTLSSFNITDAYTKTQTDTAIALKENSLGNPSISGQMLTSTTAGVRSWASFVVGHAVQSGTSTAVTQRTKLSFGSMFTVTDDAPNTMTKIGMSTTNTISSLGITDAYTQTQTNTLLNNKSNIFTTLAGYGITDAYTQTQTNTALALKENSLGNPSTSGSVLTSTTGGIRTWLPMTPGHTITGNGVALPQRSKLNFVGGGMSIYDDSTLTDTTTIQIATPQIGTALWSTNADFNASGATFTSGLVVPATNNEMKISNSIGVVTDYYNDMSMIDTYSSENLYVAGGLVQSGDGINSGTGVDGDALYSSAYTTDQNTTYIGHYVVALGTNYAVLDTTANMAVGDEVVLMNVQGTPTAYANVGNYEFLIIQAVDTSNKKITFTSNKVKFYGDTAFQDDNIALSIAGNYLHQAVTLTRVPNYNNVTIQSAGQISCYGWNATTPTRGHIIFRCKTLTVYGKIIADGFGYPAHGVAGNSENIAGFLAGSTPAPYATAGTAIGGTSGSPYLADIGRRLPFDPLDDKRLYMGGSGAGASGIAGSPGGGIIAIYCDTLTLSGGSITANGTASNYYTGGGTRSSGGVGGTIAIHAKNVNLGTGTISSYSLKNTTSASDWTNPSENGKVIFTYNTFVGTQSGQADVAYFPTGTIASTAILQSINILSGKTVTKLTQLVVNVTVLPSDGTVGVQISRDQTNWYDTNGVLNGASLTHFGVNTWDITALNWTTANFYYRITMNCNAISPAVDYTTINFLPAIYTTGAQVWTSAPFNVSAATAIRPTAVVANWYQATGNVQPRFQLIGSVNSTFTSPTYFPSSSTFYDDSSIVNGTLLNLNTTVTAYLVYWKLLISLDVGGNTLATPIVYDFTMTYVSQTTPIIDAGSSYTVEFKRGTKAALPTGLLQGEPYITLDTNELYSGQGTGNALSKISDVVVSTSQPSNYTNILWINPSTRSCQFYSTTTGWTSIWITPTITTDPTTSVSISSNILTLDCSLYNNFNVTLNQNLATVVRSNCPSASRSYQQRVIVTYSSATVYTASWNCKWSGGIVPVPTCVLGKTDIFEFTTYDGGATWYGHIVGQNMS